MHSDLQNQYKNSLFHQIRYVLIKHLFLCPSVYCKPINMLMFHISLSHIFIYGRDYVRALALWYSYSSDPEHDKFF